MNTEILAFGIMIILCCIMSLGLLYQLYKNGKLQKRNEDQEKTIIRLLKKLSEQK